MANQAINIGLVGAQSQGNLSAPGYLIIMAGQSNGTDRFTILGNLPSACQAILPKAFSYYKTVDNSADNGSWQRYHAGYTTEAGVNSGLYFSISASLAERLGSVYNRTAYCLPTAVGGTFIANDVNPSWSVQHSGQYYDRMLDVFFRRAYPALTSVGNLIPVLVWVHGESDSDTIAHGAAYQSEFSALINKFRIDTGFLNMKTLILRIRADYVGPPNAGLSGVITAMNNIASGNPLLGGLQNVDIIDMDTVFTPLSTDGQHYNPISGNFVGVQSAVNAGILAADKIATYN